MKTTKLIACICALLLIVSAFAACGKNNSEQKIPNDSIQTNEPKDTDGTTTADIENEPESDPFSGGLEYIQNGDFYYIAGIGSCTDTQIVIPETYNGLPVNAIDEYAFHQNTDITEVTIPGSVRTIGNWAFEGCTSLSKVTLGLGIHEIGGASFRGCTSLTEITLPVSTRDIGFSAFEQCTALTSVTLGNNVMRIGSNAFAGCTALTEITIPNSAEELGDGVFNGCSALTSVVLSEGVEKIGDMAFENCGLTSLTVPSTVTNLGNNCFAGCSALQEIHYNGTMEEWKAIKKGNMMYLNCSTTGAICTDGTTSY